jgi:hypothetical protein
VSAAAQNLELTPATTVNDQTLQQLATTSMPYAIAGLNQDSKKDGEVLAFYLTPDNKIYSLSGGMKIYYSDLTSKQLLGDWDLASFDETYDMKGERDSALPYIAEAKGEDEAEEVPYLDATEKQELGLAASFLDVNYSMLDPDRLYGCFVKHPLRYGDINGDGQVELALWLTESFLVFSPQSKKTIFGVNYFFEDIMDAEFQLTFAERHKRELAEMGAKAPQIFAESGADILADRVVPAVRSVAKVFFGEFDNDNKHDIIMWRKLYGSRTVGDSVKGYEKQGDVLIHYSFENGIYKKQTTESADVKAWLTSKNLTWSKGYPNKSECAGETNQLIPEMHDPLLNDSEVLQ